MYRCILVPTDGSLPSRRAARQAIGLARATGAELVALSVVPRYGIGGYEGPVALSPQDVARSEAHADRRGRSRAVALQRVAGAAAVRARAAVAHSDAVAEAVLAAARKHGCDLIVMGSHGRRGWRRLLLGSQTQAVLAASPVPVLVLR